MSFQEQYGKLAIIKEKLKLPTITAPMFWVSGIAWVTVACKSGVLIE